MTKLPGPIERRSRALRNLRARLLQRRPDCPVPIRELTDATLSVRDAILQDLAELRNESVRLRAQWRAEAETWEQLFQGAPCACVVTDATSVIRNANRAAAALLNVSASHLRDRQLLIFSKDRIAFMRLLDDLREGREHVRATVRLQPRGRRCATIDVRVVATSADAADGWLWFLSPHVALASAVEAGAAAGDGAPQCEITVATLPLAREDARSTHS